MHAWSRTQTGLQEHAEGYAEAEHCKPAMGMPPAMSSVYQTCNGDAGRNEQRVVACQQSHCAAQVAMGAQVMLTRNLNLNIRAANSCTGEVTELRYTSAHPRWLLSTACCRALSCLPCARLTVAGVSQTADATCPASMFA